MEANFCNPLIASHHVILPLKKHFPSLLVDATLRKSLGVLLNRVHAVRINGDASPSLLLINHGRPDAVLLDSVSGCPQSGFAYLEVRDGEVKGQFYDSAGRALALSLGRLDTLNPLILSSTRPSHEAELIGEHRGVGAAFGKTACWWAWPADKK